MTSQAKVAVIIAAYNAERWLAETLDSILSQSYTNFEIILINDGSSDHTAEVAARYFGKVRYHQKTNAGQPSARNDGIRLADSEYVAFVDADDLWSPLKLEKQIRLLKSSNLAWAYCDAYVFDTERPSNRIRVSQRMAMPSGSILRPLLLNCFVPSPTPVIRREVFETVGYFDESPTLRIGEDWNMWLKIAAKYPVAYVGEPLAMIRRHGGNMTARVDPSIALNSKLGIVESAIVRDPDRLSDLKDAAFANVYCGCAEALLARGGQQKTARAMYRKSLRFNACKFAALIGLLLSYSPVAVVGALREGRRLWSQATSRVDMKTSVRRAENEE